MEGHLILTGQYHLSLPPLRRLDPYGGTFDIDWSISFVPETLRRLDPYGGTIDIDWSISFVPETLTRLDPYGGTFEIEQAISYVPATLRRPHTYRGHLILTRQSHKSLPHLGGPTPMGDI